MKTTTNFVDAFAHIAGVVGQHEGELLRGYAALVILAEHAERLLKVVKL